MLHQYQTSMGSYPPKTHFETKRPLMVSYGGQVRTTQINRQQWTVLSHYTLPDNNDPVNLQLSPRYRPHLSSPVERSNWLTLEKTMERRTVFLQTRSYANNPRSNKVEISWGKDRTATSRLLDMRKDETKRWWGNPWGQQGVTVMTQHNRGSSFRYSFSQLSLQATPEPKKTLPNLNF